MNLEAIERRRKSLLVLRGARELVMRPGGWAKGVIATPIPESYEGDYGRSPLAYCLEAALLAAADGDYEAYRAAQARLEGTVGEPPISFNDAPGTESWMVVRAFSQAIDEEEQGHPVKRPAVTMYG